MESIKVKPETKKKPTKIAGMLEKKLGRKVSFDEVINYLIERKLKNKKLAEELFGIVKGENSYEELLKGRKEGEKSST
jgi:predicted CopG family antitoxin